MEEKRIDAKILRDYINSRESEITDTWTPGNFEITVRHTLPLRDVLTFVNEVVSTCFDEESGEYLPEVCLLYTSYGKRWKTCRMPDSDGNRP